MSQGGKVVNLNQSGPLSRGVTGLPSPLIRLRDLSAVQFRQILSTFFDKADDALFDLSDRAASSAEQTTYFDAMRELRMQRKELTLSFQQWLSKSFNQCGNFDAAAGKGSTGIDSDTLSLVAEEDLEEQVAIDNMVTKIRNLYSEPVEMIRMRLQKLLQTEELIPSQNPLGPEVICHGLAEACSDLAIDIRSKLVIYKLFDKLLVSQLGHLYAAANQHLIREGVLPDMRHPHQGNRKTSAPAGSAAGKASAAPVKGSDESAGLSFDQLAAMLHSGAQQGGSSGYGGADGAPSMATEDLLRLLSVAQPDPAALGVAGTVQSGQGLPLGSVVQNLVRGGQTKHSVGQVESDVINLVTMLFDFILEDRQLPDAMKALLARLQIPVLKVALLDKSFFNRGGHPARKLLNELATAALGWTEKPAGQRDSLRDKIAGVVDQLLNDFSDNVEIFDELLQDFTKFADIERRRRELVEQRLRDAEEGRARNQQAQDAVSKLLDEVTSGRELPKPVRQLLDAPWRRALQWHWLREGEAAEVWQEMTQLTGQLVWSVDPQPVTRTTRTELLRHIPDIVDGVRRGLNAIAWDPFEIDEWVRELELIHVDTLQHLATAPVRAKADPVTPQAQTPAVPAAPATPEAATEPKAGPVAEDDVHKAWYDRARALRVGCWVEWQPDTDRRVRCKLAAIIKATGKYIFVNRSGAKVIEYTEDEVAKALSTSEIGMLDDGLIFDRALESVIDNLRHSRKD